MKSKIIIYLKKQTLILSVLISGIVFSQTYPDLEMGNVTPNPNTNTNVTVALQKDTNNNTGTTLVNYTTPSAISVNYNVNAVSFTDALHYGSGGAAPFYTLMNTIGNAGNDNTEYTSFGVPANGTGIDINANYGVYIEAVFANAGSHAGNGRVKFGEITINLSRSVNNPLLHFKGLGGNSGGTSFTAEFTVKSILNSSGTQILSGTTISQLSGTNLNVNNTDKTINNDYTGNTNPATTNSGRGTVRFQNNDITTIVLEVYGNRNGSSGTATAWAGTDAFLIGVSAGESDLRVTKTVNNPTPNVGSSVIFTVTASNLGASNNTNVTVNDLLPNGYTYVSHTSSTGTYVPGTGVWTIGNLNDQANATLTVTANVNASGNYMNTATISGDLGDPASINNSAAISTAPAFCYEIPSNTGSTVPVKYGITLLGRAEADNGNWPMLRNSAYTVLESKTKGFVITRNANPETTINYPVVGMMVFDTDANSGKGCLKIYTGNGAGEGWKCFTTQTCP